MTMTIEQINELSQEQFVELLGAIFENSPWVTAAAWHARPFASREALHTAMANVIRESRLETIIDLFRAHPDLGTRLAVAEYSEKEQQGAGLNQLSVEEYEKFDGINKTYTKTFGFPFIFAVRGKTKEDILAAMEERIGHTVSEEISQALEEVEKITAFRIQDIIIE